MKVEYVGNDCIVYNSEFSLALTLDCGQAFRFYEKDGIWYGVVGKRELKMQQQGEKITFFDTDKERFENELYHYFSFDFDYVSLEKTLAEDETLKKAISVADGIHILKQDKWETICSFIISQNNNIPRIKGIIDRLCISFGEKCGNVYSFPTAEKIARLTLEDLSVIRAGFRAKYIIDAADKIASGQIDLDALESMPFDDARAELMKIKGVGPKVAECALLFCCARYEAFPLDVWMKRVMEQFYPDGLPENAGQYKGIAQQYLFHYARTLKI